MVRWKIEILRDRTNRPSHVEINAIPEHLSACWHQTTRNIVRLYTFLDWCETAELAEQIVRARKIAFDMRERTESRVLFVGVVNQNYMWNVDITLLDNDTLVSTVDKCSLLAIELCPVCMVCYQPCNETHIARFGSGPDAEEIEVCSDDCGQHFIDWEQASPEARRNMAFDEAGGL